MTTLAIDLGGTNFRAGLVDGQSVEPHLLGRWPAPASRDDFRARIETLMAQHRADSLGVCIPGLARGTVCAWTPNLPFLDGVDLRAMFPGIRVALGNDAQLALLAEAAAGAAQDARNAILLAIGTGIGSAVLADARILRGEGGAAASFGWACADPSDPGDDAHGWLERSASGTALDRIAASLGLADGPALIAGARAGDKEALAALERPAAALATTLAGAVALTGSPLVVFAGGVVEGLDVLEPLVLPALSRQLPPHLRSVRLAPARFGTRAALVGAGLAAGGHPAWVEDQ
ncbi:ROK family protein [Mesorhizobium marinum]|uniref:ROK family protein n=1 Tax=Mesorhizobium marinum TaxID=3228790 RepID=UPI00346694C6